ncbi:MAG: response regulator [Paenibacillus sp.]|nr:response regulator [Paenibacillus sp.]
MYKVLLVDDEFLILDGISSVINWEAAGTRLIGTAQNGLEALEIIRQEPPDIIITDIRMPGMDGLELTENVYLTYPDVSFIMLTGFSEFEYVKKAMQFGIKHYLLKPCSEESLMEALEELVAEKRERDEREEFVQSIKYGLQRVMPHAKEQFLKEFVTNKTYGAREWQFFGELFGLGMQGQKVRMLLFEIEGEHEYEHVFAVKNIAEDIFQNRLLSSSVGEHVLLLLEDTLPEEEIFGRIGSIRTVFGKHYRLDLTAALSESGELSLARRLYKQTLECLRHRFYLGEGSLITERDIYSLGDSKVDPSFDEERLIMPIKAGHWEDAERELLHSFSILSSLRLEITEAKSYIIQLFMAIIRLGAPELMRRYLDKLSSMIETGTLHTLQQLVLSVAEEITQERYERNCRKQSQLVLSMKNIVQRRIGEETLSLQSVANEIYMSPDYVSKVFRKETGEKFTNYCMRLRMESAVDMLEQEKEVKISELAEQTGFGDNPQYFSKMFKKFTGYSPSEYKKSP